MIDLEGSKVLTPIIAVAISMVLAVYNLLFNNLLMNLRFYLKMKSSLVGIVCYDAINLCQCQCFLEPVCRDKCFSIPTAIKWVFKAIVMGATIAMIG